MADDHQQMVELLKDLVKINAIIATELIQLVENSSKQLRGDIPESCKIQHGELRKEVVELAEKWSNNCNILRSHNLKHD
ncbi:MAG: hypothetical protein MUP22_02100 [Desulfobacterales bacterium]|nr:hypothetical protein [Desulfobacterales bacterium]